jgi:hypothetical protein
VTSSPLREPGDPRIEACQSVAARTRTATGRHRQRGPPTRSANEVRQLTPPSSSASQGAPTRERQLPVTTYHDREPANRRIEACRSVAAQSHTATGDTANVVRQLTPPSSSASQRAPTAGDHLPRSVTCRSSHRSVPISRRSIPHRHRRHRQRGPPTDTANRHRQVPPPVRERQLPVTTSPDRHPADPRIEAC